MTIVTIARNKDDKCPGNPAFFLLASGEKDFHCGAVVIRSFDTRPCGIALDFDVVMPLIFIQCMHIHSYARSRVEF